MLLPLLARGEELHHHGQEPRGGSSTTWPMLAELTTPPTALLDRWPERAGLAETLRLEPSSPYTIGLQAKALPWEGEKGRRTDRKTEGERESEERQRDGERALAGPIL